MTRRNQRARRVERWRQIFWGTVLAGGGALLLLLVVSLFLDDMGIRKYMAMLQHARQLERDIRNLERQNAELRTDMYRTQHDPGRIEELARERLGYVKKGDMVYQIVPDRGQAEQDASRSAP